MAGIRTMGNLSHELESFIEGIETGALPVEQSALDVMQASLDELHRMRDAVNQGQTVAPAHELIQRIRNLAGFAAPEDPVESVQPARVSPKPAASAPRSAPVIAHASAPPLVVELVSIPDVAAAALIISPVGMPPGNPNGDVVVGCPVTGLDSVRVPTGPGRNCDVMNVVVLSRQRPADFDTVSGGMDIGAPDRNAIAITGRVDGAADLVL